ncbi:uncharacterized protein VTP21DRAFT_484 [Calcarisporiella thermophila]|uniref:uncharacterized protein n=1 Tax=Calcarisporiella thermophila TaxID=911321 RepID=UPI003744A798
MMFSRSRCSISNGHLPITRYYQSSAPTRVWARRQHTNANMHAPDQRPPPELSIHPPSTASSSTPPPQPPPPSQRAWFKPKFRHIFVGAFALYSASVYYMQWREQKKRDTVNPDTVLHWRITDGSIVETNIDTSPTRKLPHLLNPTPGPVTKVSTLYEIIRAIKLAKDDDRIVGIMANMSSGGTTGSAPQSSLGFAQVQEIREALDEFRQAKIAKFGADKCKLIAFADTYTQMYYYLASAFDHVAIQPTGQVPLVGLSSTVTFFKQLLNRFGIYVRGEARREYKSAISPFTETKLTPEQRSDLDQLLSSLNTDMLQDIASSRKNSMNLKENGETNQDLFEAVKRGPFMSEEAQQMGLVDTRTYKRNMTDMIKENAAMGLIHYLRVREVEKLKEMKASNTPNMVVGVVYLIGTITRTPGYFGANAVVKALREAAEDETVDAIVLRIDSGGGDVIASDTIHDAVQYVQEEKKIPVVASFGNVAASGGYFVATHCAKILAQPTTITGSIGVAMLRPHISQEFFKWAGIDIEQTFMGSKAESLLIDLEGEDLERWKRTADIYYADFKSRVAAGRNLDPEKVEDLAKGRLWSGRNALSVGLIDEQGGIYRAIRVAAELGLKRRLESDLKEEVKALLPKKLDDSMEVVVKSFPAKRTFIERLKQLEEVDSEAWENFAGGQGEKALMLVTAQVAQFIGEALHAGIEDFVDNLKQRAVMSSQPRYEMEVSIE